MSEHNLILEFYKPTYNLDFDYDGDGGLDLHFTNIKGEFFMTMNDSYNSVYIEDEDCEFSKGEMFATVDLGDLVERIINGEFRQTNGKAVSDWGKRFIGDGEEQIEFNGKNYADGSLFWDDFFKEMPKNEIKDFMAFCEDYLDLPNIEVDTVSDKYDFENGKVELKSNGKWGITVNDDYTIISVDEFTCDSTDAFVAYDVASSESDEDDFYESKKSARKSLKERGRRTEFFDIQHLSGSEWVAYPYDKEGDNIPYDKIEYTSDGHFYAYVGDKIVDKDSDIYYKYRTEIIDSIEDDGYDVYIAESKKSTKRSLTEGISAFNKAIAKKYNDTEPNGAGQYYLDWRFDLHDEKDNIEAIADRCGVTVEFQSDEGYFEVFEESKKSTRKSLKEKVTVAKSLKIIERALLDLIHDDTIQEEFNMAFDDVNGIYDSVDDMFEVSVHNVLNKLLKEHTITVLPF